MKKNIYFFFKHMNWTLFLLNLILNIYNDTPDIHNNLGPEITNNNGRYLPLDYRWYLMYRISQQILAQNLRNEALANEMPTELLLLYGTICLIPTLVILFKGVYSASSDSIDTTTTNNEIDIEDC